MPKYGSHQLLEDQFDQSHAPQPGAQPSTPWCTAQHLDPRLGPRYPDAMDVQPNLALTLR